MNIIDNKVGANRSISSLIGAIQFEITKYKLSAKTYRDDLKLLAGYKNIPYGLVSTKADVLLTTL